MTKPKKPSSSSDALTVPSGTLPVSLGPNGWTDQIQELRDQISELKTAMLNLGQQVSDLTSQIKRGRRAGAAKFGHIKEDPTKP